MNNEQVIPNSSVNNVPTFTILSNGREINPGIQVQAIEVERTANKIPLAVLWLRDGDAATQEFELSDADTFKPGATLEIQTGYDSNDETVFKGIVIKQKVKFEENGNALLRIECRGGCFKLALGRKSKYFTDSKDSDVIQGVLGGYGMAGQIDATSVTHREIVQFHSSDWDFILSRAEANGRLLLVNGEKVDVKAPDSPGAPVLQLAYGGNLLEFEAEMDARTQWKKTKAQSWNFANQAVEEHEAGSVSFQENGNLSGAVLADVGGLGDFALRHSGHLPQDELKSWTEACLLKSRLAKIRGRARFNGFVKVKLGDWVELGGLSRRFNGMVYVTGVRYELTEGTCYTNLQFGLPLNWFHQQQPDIMDSPAAGLMPGIHGLQIGKVIQLEGDPDGEARILVKMPILDPQGEGAWARLASLDAGNNRGWVIRPEIDDEVILGFVNGDPRDAVILGMLHSTAFPPPIPPADDNHIKGYTTRSEMKVEFDDDQKIITISTPAGNSITISEADKEIAIVDQNNNECRFNPDGIAMKSPGDIKIEATGKIDIKATGDLSLQGMNLNGKANAALKMEGGASAELSSGGQTTVKGGMVMIN
ncbi:MAG: type VI secretion system tip protein VgrG [Saprospiraceae bacterium]|nr:type VI secretion system tip protein VgrG [Saprospiraceae bacterium]